MTEEESGVEQDQTKFNMGIALLQRIAQLQEGLVISSMQKDHLNTYNLLFRIETEIDFLLNDDERKDLGETKKELFNLMESNKDRGFTWFLDPSRTGKIDFSLVPKELLDDVNKFVNLLNVWDRKLRILMSGKGMLMPPQDESNLYD